MKILQLANGYYDSRVYQNLFSYEEALGIENEIFVPLNRNKKIKAADCKNVHTVKCFNDLDRLLFFSKQAKMQKEIEAIFDVRSFDMIHAHTVFSGGYTAYKFHLKYGIPYMVAVRSTDMKVFFKYVRHLRSTGVEILKNASRIVFLSRVYLQQLTEKYIPAEYCEEIKQKSIIIPNGISEVFLNNMYKARPAPADELRLVFVGDLSTLKNPETVVKAAEKLRKNGTAVSLKMIGDIKREKYRRLINENKWIEYHERCPQREVIEYMRESDILIVPSHRETFGLVYAEAMSQGLPVLYTRGQGFDGQFEDGEVGYAVSDRDANDVVDKILKIKENYGKISSCCAAYADRFDWEKIALIYKNEYEKFRVL